MLRWRMRDSFTPRARHILENSIREAGRAGAEQAKGLNIYF